MCCLFGLIDCRDTLTPKQKSQALHALATAAEERGTDATGIAYLSRGHMHVYKRPLPGHRLHFRIPSDTQVVMGHARMTTQGSAKKNYNNHPFQSRAGGQPFALAHNGVIYNDLSLRHEEKLPRTNIQTDTYVAVQLLERGGTITPRTLKHMAEKLEGTFSFTVLDDRNSLYFVRGNNPLCIRYFPVAGLYLYASTGEILDKAMESMPLPLGTAEPVETSCGDILKIDLQGNRSYSRFDDSRLWYGSSPYSFCLNGSGCSWNKPAQFQSHTASGNGYVQALKSVAGAFGFSAWDIDQLLQDGFTEEEIEDYLYCGEL